MINNKIYKNKSMNDSEFYFDIEKFILLYKFIKKYEVEREQEKEEKKRRGKRGGG